MSADEFTKLFKYVQQISDRVIRIEENMATKDDIRQLTTIIDGYAAKLDAYAMEMAAQNRPSRALYSNYCRQNRY